MGKLLVKEKQLVVPGEVLAEGMDYLPASGAFRENNKLYSSQVGLISIDGRLVKIVPLSGKYVPRRGDTVIGKIVDINFGGWQVDIGTAYEANLSMKEATSDFIERGADLTQYYDFGDIICTKITKVIRNKIIDLTTKGPGLRKLKGGKIIDVTPSKVPRIIGKQGSMISMIKEATGCTIIVGQNGRVWLSGNDPKSEKLATDIILKVNNEAHKEGLTDEIKNFLDRSK